MISGHATRRLFEQAVRAGQGQNLPFARRTSSTAACCSADGSACFFFATPSSVAVIRRQPFSPSSSSTRQAGNTVSRTVPDPLDELPSVSRNEVIADVQAALSVDEATAEDIVRSAEPLWDTMERAGGLVDSWGGSEFCYVLPRVLTFIRTATGGG